MTSTAFFWGIISAISLPIGAWLGLWTRPSKKINSIFMAFGGGALLFALTIELFGHVPHHVESHGSTVIWVVFASAILGGVTFSGLNAILNNYGAFMRRLSSARHYLERVKYKRSKILVEKLGKIKVLNELSPELMADLLHELELKTYDDGEVICRQGDEAEEMFFIISGEVEIIRHVGNESNTLAMLGKYDSFGELGVIQEDPRTADAIARESVQIYSISRDDFKTLLKEDKTVRDKIMKLAAARLDELTMKTDVEVNEDWQKQTMDFLDKEQVAVTTEEIRSEGETRSHGNASLAIWLGIFIDAIPESLVIGLLVVSPTGVSLAFIVGVFLANMPEAMSSSVSMRDNGLSLGKIYLMWGSITLVTGLGAALGSVIFPPDPVGGLYYFMVGIEALAAGAMLTMISETMLPEAFEMGGSVVGLSTLAGFLSALLVKVI